MHVLLVLELESLTGDNSVCLGQGFCTFKYNLSLFPSSVHVVVYSCVPCVYSCSCVPVYFDGLKQVQRTPEAPECTGV